MEKHQQAIIVGLSYLIGFTTAFIAFAINESDHYKVVDNISSQSLTAQNAVADGFVTVVDKSDGLFMQKNNQERLLSAKTSVFPAEVGFHNSIVVASVSPSGRYIHYCAQIDPSMTVCENFIYSVEADVVYQVKDQDGVISTSKGLAAAVNWDVDDSLWIENQSANAGSKWYLR